MATSLRSLMDMRGRVALVTGGAGYIGNAACDTLGELGVTVAVLDSDAGRTRTTVDRLTSAGIAASSHVLDLADTAAVQQLPQQLIKQHGRMDVIVHAAAFVNQGNEVGYATSFERQDVSIWQRALGVNLTSAFALVQAATPFLGKHNVGSVILLGSIYGMVGPDMRLYEGSSLGNAAAYAASKGGVLQLTRWLATVLAPKVRVNALTPGGIARNHPATFQQRYANRTPLGRMGTEDDLKGAIAYLASDLSAYVTGQNLAVDGGWTSW